MANVSRNDRRVKRHKRVRKNLTGTPEKPRLVVFRSNKNISAQIIDDGYGGNKEAAKKVGEALAKRALAKGIDVVAFDRGGFLYHGRVKELADGAREGGLKF